MSPSTRQQWITHDLERTTGVAAQQANIDAGKAVATAVRTTLGPAGRDKMLIGTDGTVVITNDGASILDRLDIDDPAAQMIVQAASAQNETVGDGVTTMVLLVGELLSKAETLLNDGLHPTTIIEGYYHSVAYARQRLEEYSVDFVGSDDELLQAVAKTAVTGRWGTEATDQFSALTTDAVRAIECDGEVDTTALTTKAFPGGELQDSALIDGILVDMDASSTTIKTLDSGFSSPVTNARLAFVNNEITVETPEGVGNVTVTAPEQLDSFRAYESNTQGEIVRTLVDLDVDILLCQKSIDDTLRSRLTNEGILAIERTRQDEFDALVRATAASAVQSVTDLGQTNIGSAGSVEQRSVGPANLLIVTDLPEDRQTSLLLRGGTKHVAEETKRIIESCIAVVQATVQEGCVLPGGGAIEAALARDLYRYAESINSRQQLAAKAFAGALESIPRALIDNAGYDPLELLPQLRNCHEENFAVGISPSVDALQDMLEAGVVEPQMTKQHCLVNAVETTAMILRIDDILQHTELDSNENTASYNRTSQAHTQQSTSGYPWAIGH